MKFLTVLVIVIGLVPTNNCALIIKYSEISTHKFTAMQVQKLQDCLCDNKTKSCLLDIANDNIQRSELPPSEAIDTYQYHCTYNVDDSVLLNCIRMNARLDCEKETCWKFCWTNNQSNSHQIKLNLTITFDQKISDVITTNVRGLHEGFCKSVASRNLEAIFLKIVPGNPESVATSHMFCSVYLVFYFIAFAFLLQISLVS